MTLLITEQETTELLNGQAAIAVIEDMFRMMGEHTTQNSQRLEMPSEHGFMAFRAGALHSRGRMGFKILTNLGSGPVLVWNFLYDMVSGELLAIIQSRAISGFRTSAATAVAAKYLSPAQASAVGMCGTGRQAAAQLAAICAVRPIKVARVYSRDPGKREAFCRSMSERLGIDVVAATTPEQVPREADIIVTITNTQTPVLFGDWITRPCLIIGAGANEWYEREVDEKLVAKARLIVVDNKEDAKRNAGDLLWPISHGLLRWDRVEELGDVIAGGVALPDFGSGIILFESLGIALEDVAIANEAYELAQKRGIGRTIQL